MQVTRRVTHVAQYTYIHEIYVGKSLSGNILINIPPGNFNRYVTIYVVYTTG